ncbi:hypothetical protein ACTHAM_001479 [Cellulomonas soli]|uniref:hypothetical protein n=1 Tax=Cellulomonas soli TaxID=931535 RepID=UPI003F86C284
MTITAPTPPVAVGPPDPGATPPPTSPAALAARVRAARGRPTPVRMRSLAAALVVVGLLVSATVGWSFWSADRALGRADANAAQLVRLQDLQTRLVRADADATNAFLVGGLEPADQRADYDQAIDDATVLVTQAARAQPADGALLSDLNTAIVAYTNDVELARAANRQGLPVGSQYLRNASASLRADALPALAALIDADAARVEAELDNARNAWALATVAGLVAIAALVGGSVWLARRTHRYLNGRLVGAGLVLVALTVGSTVVLGSVTSQVTHVRDTDYAGALALAQARLTAYDAKADESLTLIARGSGGAFEEAWVASAAATVASLQTATDAGAVSSTVALEWDSYAQLHHQIRALDDGGAWDDAVAAATDRSEGSANAAFAAFDTSSGDALDRAGQATSAGLADAAGGLTLATWLAVLAGLGVAALCWGGISRRIEEYR